MKIGKVVLLFVLLSGLILITGCGATDKSVNKDEVKQETNIPKEKGLADVVQYFKSQGFKVGEVKTKAFDMLGAIDGFGIDVDGEQIELYIFDPNKANDETKKNLDDAEKIGKFSAFGMSIPVIKNGNIILMRYSEHSNKEKIIQTFKNFN